MITGNGTIDRSYTQLVVVELFDVELLNTMVTLKCGLEVTQGH